MTLGIIRNAPTDLHLKVDTKGLAEELSVTATGCNPARFCTVDDLSYLSSEILDFHGVKCAWVESMDVKEMMHALSHNDYTPVTGNRYTNFVFKAGKPIDLLRQPDGKYWVMQDAGTEVMKDLNVNNLDQVGSKLKNLPAGWKWESKVLSKDLVLDTCLSGGYIKFLRDEVGCAHQAVGVDNSANYIP